ncbi:MAG: NAD(P)-dependent oxidoreductase [Carboxylicivirga sp.]|jgi:nucleoside-diphosphate-sugar epimerase|nr:NAD(P)-dependent oxidoreductase [Carboxylicivirga sp.]
MNILITGSTGFVGRNLVPVLLEKGHSILEISRDFEKSHAFFGDATFKMHPTDLNSDKAGLLKDFNPAVVIHLAAKLSSSDSFEVMEDLLESNIILTCKLLDAIKSLNVKLFINTGTFAEYANGKLVPAYLYAATKTASRCLIDYYSNAYSFKQVTVVPYTIYGGIDTQKKIIDIMFDSISSTTSVDLSPGDQVLDFVHVSDIIKLYEEIINSIEALPDVSVFHGGTGIGTTLKELAKIIESVSSSNTNINWGGRPYRKTDVMYAVANQSYTNFCVDWTPRITLKEGVRLYIKGRNSTI